MDGKYFYFNVPLDLDYTNLPTHSIFLPILYKLVLSSVAYEMMPYYYPGSLGYVNAEFVESPPRIQNEELELIPEFSPQNDGVSFLIPDLPAGFYWLKHNLDTFQIAINVPRAESAMVGLTLQELEQNFGELNHVTIQSAEAQVVVDTENGNDLWKYALILVVFFLVVETLFHKYLK